ncbi:glycerate kinase [Bacillus sp. AFS055030]|uniref:glycerate kinase family protein n=1 Tax=Bacillus sp. AFS055030 TaxID=2033507 RepID=UPI0015D4843C|nr:glycerate kinase [Bacillus sp. AFS055030]
MNIIVAIDSFKGSITSLEATEVIKNALPQHNIIGIPVADGGEGTVTAFVQALKGEMITETVPGPKGQPIQASYGWIDSDQTAIIEVAQASGITLIESSDLNPYCNSSFGTGAQIVSALNRGAKKIIIGLGGSATIDCGKGIMEALGVKFLNKYGHTVPTFPHSIDQVTEIDTSKLDPRLANVEFIIASDVTNPLLGKNGATFIFGAQKGLHTSQMNDYDEMIKRFADTINQSLATNYIDHPGAGAAGGIGFMLYSFLGATYQSGIELLMKECDLEASIEKANLLITGEGRFDSQSLAGKLPIGVSLIAKKHNVPTIVFAGSIEDGLTELTDYGIIATIPIVSSVMTLEDAMTNASSLLHLAVKRTFNLIDNLSTRDTSAHTQ